MSVIRTEIGTRMTETSGCATTSRPPTTADDQQVVMGRSGGGAGRLARRFCGAVAVSGSRPIFVQRNQFPVNRGFRPSKLPHAKTDSTHGAPTRCRPEVIPLCSSCQR